MPRAMRHDLSELPYSPTIWQRIGGPWSITLRAYLWTAPLGILAQPVVEPSFWNEFGTLPLWLLSAGLGYLTFGVVLWLGWFIFIDRRRSAFTSPLLVISVAIAASMARRGRITGSPAVWCLLRFFLGLHHIFDHGFQISISTAP